MVPGRKAWSSSSLGPQLPRKLSPWAALGRRFFSFLSGLRVTPPKVDSKQRSTVSPSVAAVVRVEPLMLPASRPKTQEPRASAVFTSHPKRFSISFFSPTASFGFSLFIFCDVSGAARCSRAGLGVLS